MIFRIIQEKSKFGVHIWSLTTKRYVTITMSSQVRVILRIQKNFFFFFMDERKIHIFHSFKYFTMKFLKSLPIVGKMKVFSNFQWKYLIISFLHRIFFPFATFFLALLVLIAASKKPRQVNKELAFSLFFIRDNGCWTRERSWSFEKRIEYEVSVSPQWVQGRYFAIISWIFVTLSESRDFLRVKFFRKE